MKKGIPYILSRAVLWKVCLLILFSTFFILFFLQPFGDIMHGYTLIGLLRTLSYAIVASAIVFLTEAFLGRYYRTKIQISQTIYGSLIWYLLVLLAVILGIYLCRTSWIGWNNTSIYDLGIVVYRVMILAVIPFALMAFVLILYNGKSRDHEIAITSNDVNSEYLKLSLNSILYLESEDNYTAIYMGHNDAIKKKLVRGSLSYIENQLQFPIVRIHRSCLVNLKKVMQVKMNSSGGKLEIEGIEKQLSISRKYLKQFQNHWTQIN